MDQKELNSKRQLCVNDLISWMEELAPKELALDYDNVGLILGDLQQKVRKILVTLEITDETVDRICDEEIDLVIAHHPLIFKGIRSVRSEDVIGRKLIRLIKANTAVYAAHTNLDKAQEGLNSYLIKKLGFHDVDEMYGDVRYASVKKQKLLNLVQSVQKKLQLEHIHYVGDEEKMVSRIGICSGSGMSYYQEAVRHGIDVYISGDLKYHDAIYAKEYGVPVIDATHFGTEILVNDLLSSYLNRKWEQVRAQYDHSLEIIKEDRYHNPIRTI